MMTVEVCGRVSVPSVSPGGSSNSDAAPLDDVHSEGGLASPPARDTTEPPVHRPKFMITDILAQRVPPAATEEKAAGGGASATQTTDTLKGLDTHDDDHAADDGGSQDDDGEWCRGHAWGSWGRERGWQGGGRCPDCRQ